MLENKLKVKELLSFPSEVSPKYCSELTYLALKEETRRMVYCWATVVKTDNHFRRSP